MVSDRDPLRREPRVGDDEPTQVFGDSSDEPTRSLRDSPDEPTALLAREPLERPDFTAPDAPAVSASVPVSHQHDEPTLTDLGRDEERRMTALRRRARRRRFARRLVAVLVVLAVLMGGAAVLAERLVRPEVESIVQRQVSAALGGSQTTTIVHDRIVLTSLARDRLDKVTGWTDKAVLSDGDQSVTLDHLDFTATGVRHLRASSGPVVDQLDATATLGWSEAARLTGLDIRPVDGGRVEIRHHVEIWGATVPITFSAVPGVDPATRRLTLSDPKASLSRVEIPQALLGPLVNRLAERAVLPEVLSLRYTSLTASAEGLKIGLSGTDVALQQ